MPAYDSIHRNGAGFPLPDWLVQLRLLSCTIITSCRSSQERACPQWTGSFRLSILMKDKKFLDLAPVIIELPQGRELVESSFCGSI